MTRWLDIVCIVHGKQKTGTWDIIGARNEFGMALTGKQEAAAIVNLVKLQRYVQNVYRIYSAGERARTSERSSGWLASRLVSRSDREFVHSHAIHSAGFFMDRTQLLGSLSVLNASGTTVPVNVSPWSPPTSADHSPV